MNFFKTIFATVVMSVAFIANAQANTFSIGTSFDEDIYVAKSSTSFEKIYSINLSEIGNISYSLSEIESLPLLNIDFLNIGLYNASNNPVTNLTGLASGVYTLMVTGKSTGVAGGVFNLQFNVSAVPEPETYALMFLGLGMIGLITRRKFV